MTFPSNLSRSATRSLTALPALLLLCQAAVGCKEDDARPTPGGPPGAGGNGDGDGGMGGGDPSGTGGEGAGETGGTSATGGFGGLPVEGMPCDEVECHPLATCDDSGQTAECVCPEGLSGDDCADVDECLDPSTCDPGTICLNTHGGYLCQCLEGQSAAGGDCADILECDADPCDDNATCTEGDNTFSCSCDDGYFGNGFSCSNTNNCDDDSCGGNGTCVTTPSGYVCLCDPGFGGASDCSIACDVLSFPDPALEAAVRAAIGKPSGAIGQADIQNTTALYLAGEDIFDLSGLECWSHLEVLDLNDTPLGEMPATYPNALSALADLTELRALYLGCTAVSELDLLAEHPTLERLGVGRYTSCQAGSVDLSALGSISGLRWLDISGLELSSLASVEGLTALEYLAASNNSITDVASLSSLLSLKGLYLDGNQISDISALSDLTFLQELDLAENQLASMVALTPLTLLRTLSLGDNQLESLAELSTFGALSFFDARNNQIDSLSSIASLGPMTWVGLAGNNVSSLDTLVGTALRGALSVLDNPIDCDEEEENISTLAGQGLSVISDCSN